MDEENFSKKRNRLLSLVVWTEDGFHKELVGSTPEEIWQKRDELESQLGKKLDHFALH